MIARGEVTVSLHKFLTYALMDVNGRFHDWPYLHALESVGWTQADLHAPDERQSGVLAWCPRIPPEHHILQYPILQYDTQLVLCKYCV